MPDLRDARFEHDACGTGFVATTAGRSHAVLELALEAVARLTHRGAVSADGKTGDGAGVLTQIPYRLLVPDLYRLGVRPPRHADLGVAMAFLPRDVRGQVRARSIIEDGRPTRCSARPTGTSSSATPCSTGRPAGSFSPRAARASGSPSATAAPSPWWRARAITAAST